MTGARTGVTDLPLHPGRAPRWLFVRMKALARGIVEAMVDHGGPELVLERLSDPFWFQALSCVLGFDWHSSGSTTVTCGALKEACKGIDGVVVVGGKGRRALETPREIAESAKRAALDPESLVRASYMAAKVDSAVVQDGHTIYHHTFIFTDRGRWAVVQQGLSEERGYARRYHWLSDDMSSFTREPHKGIVGRKTGIALDMSALESEAARKASLDAVTEGPARLRRWIELIKNPGQTSIEDFCHAHSPTRETLQVQYPPDRVTDPAPDLVMPRHIDWDAMARLYHRDLGDYDELISERGVGPAAVRALALVAQLIYGERPAWKDPVRYSFAVGGKDGVPYPVNRRTYDETITWIREGIERAKCSDRTRLNALKRLAHLDTEEAGHEA